MLRLKLTPELIYKIIKKHLVSNKSSEIENEESSIDLNLNNENKKEEIQEKIENNIKVNKNLNPTIENFSSIKKDTKVSDEKSDDIKIEIKENKEEEVLDDDLIAKNLVKNYSVTLTSDERGLKYLNDYKNLNLIKLPSSPLIKKNITKIVI